MEGMQVYWGVFVIIMLRGTLDGPTTARVCDENLTTQRNLYHSAVGAVSARKYSQSCSLQKGTRDSPKPCCKMLI